MGEILLSKLDIDVMVQVAVLGPMEAVGWNPSVDDAEHEDADSAWARSGIRARLNALRHRLLQHVPDYRDAPWGWRANDLADRASRPAPTIREPSPRLFDVLEIWDQVGLAMRTGPGGLPATDLGDPRRLLGNAYWFPPNTVGFAPLSISICADADAAQLAFLLYVRSRKEYHGSRDGEARVYRFGDVVAGFQWGDEETELAGQFRNAIDVLSRPEYFGAPDEQWWSRTPPDRELRAEVLANEVLLDPSVATRMNPNFAIVVRTPAEQARLALWLTDEALRARVTAISTRRQSLVLFTGIAAMDGVTSAALRTELIDQPGQLAMGPHLEFHASSATGRTFSLVAVDRLPSTPREVRFEAPSLLRDMPAGPPSP